MIRKSRWTGFLDWLFPHRLSEFAQCKYCHSIVTKSRMIWVDGYGWFCDEDEFEQFWRLRQSLFETSTENLYGLNEVVRAAR